VKALEATLGVRLFQGPKHRLSLTPAGQDLLPRLTHAFDEIAVATQMPYRGAEAVVRIAPAARLSDPLVTPFIPNHTGPVMTPALARRFAADPLAAPRLTAQSHPQGWAIWAAVAGYELAPAPEQPFPHVHFALDAALAGLGVTIASWPLVAEEIAEGRLVAPLGFRRTESAFALLAAPGAESRALAAFRKWLVVQGDRTPTPP
jgi:LysR family glycine cleavage system transcriptional activator